MDLWFSAVWARFDVIARGVSDRSAKDPASQFRPAFASQERSVLGRRLLPRLA
jgi:hypothetical protein